jgi:LacI family transcriptional regulator
MVTMADVARAADVSTTTVSHVLNGTRPVSPATVERVRAAIAQTGYSQNTIARALARARTQSLGLAINGLSNPYFTDVIAAVEEEASRANHTLLLGDTHDDPEHELVIVRALVERRVDGLLLAPSPGAAEHTLPYLATQELPVVLLDRLIAGAPLDQIGADNAEPTAELVDHLAALGHTRIGMVVGTAGLSTTDERVAGYRQGLARHGLPVDDALIVGGGSQRDAARDAVLGLLDLSDRPTALISGNNAMTIGAMRALKERGLRVPDDIALVAFDDFEWADLFEPRLCVVRQPTAELGHQAVRMLLDRLADGSRPPRTVRLPTTFVHRDSCGPATEREAYNLPVR